MFLGATNFPYHLAFPVQQLVTQHRHQHHVRPIAPQTHPHVQRVHTQPHPQPQPSPQKPPQTEQLVVTVIRAKLNLSPNEQQLVAHMQLYAYLRWTDGGDIGPTLTCTGSHNPVWNSDFSLTSSPNRRAFSIAVIDSKTNALLGTSTVDVGTVHRDSAVLVDLISPAGFNLGGVEILVEVAVQQQQTPAIPHEDANPVEAATTVKAGAGETVTVEAKEQPSATPIPQPTTENEPPGSEDVSVTSETITEITVDDGVEEYIGQPPLSPRLHTFVITVLEGYNIKPVGYFLPFYHYQFDASEATLAITLEVEGVSVITSTQPGPNPKFNQAFRIRAYQHSQIYIAVLNSNTNQRLGAARFELTQAGRKLVPCLGTNATLEVNLEGPIEENNEIEVVEEEEKEGPSDSQAAEESTAPVEEGNDKPDEAENDQTEDEGTTTKNDFVHKLEEALDEADKDLNTLKEEVTEKEETTTAAEEKTENDEKEPGKSPSEDNTEKADEQPEDTSKKENEGGGECAEDDKEESNEETPTDVNEENKTEEHDGKKDDEPQGEAF